MLQDTIFVLSAPDNPVSNPIGYKPLNLQCFSSLLLQFNPLIQSKRLIIRILTETVNHITRDALFLTTGIHSDRISGHLLKLFQKSLILRVMHMTIKHIGLWLSLLIQTILPVITHNRVMAQHYLPPVIRQLLVWLNPLETARIHILVREKTIMIPLNQIQPSVQTF